ncbi:Do family serine endopeptidase [Chitinasiproducens palmae]|uniref:Serine protease DegQ n=1 Tax=Chitinasiproducens palmae TaxID=1770053 RepID=A0A1H2PVC0_9BURK|nr:Do family serine endopeptidase [Chitinasiproducens palmae]SDV51266.1 serine protease DegQ [Chitinasiproducens palmae]
MLRRLWLLFAQVVTVALALLFIVATLQPQWLNWRHLTGKPAGTERVRPGRAALPIAPACTQCLDSYSDAAQRAMPAVVNVFSSKDRPRRGKRNANDPMYRYYYGKKGQRQDDSPVSNLGSGVIVSSDGYILTNQHVVDGADEIEVALADGRKKRAKLIGVDPDTDLAVLKIDEKDLPTISLDRKDPPRVGDVVLAIGNPFGVGQTVTMGIISALGRNHLGITPFEDFIQTDAAINPGNSGGALVDVKGNLIGINTAIYSRSGGSLGIGFATPVSTATAVLHSLLTTGTVTRGWIGVEPQDLTPEIAESFKMDQTSGAIVAGVLQGGPADKAGVKPGDIIVGVDGDKIDETTRLLNTIAKIAPGTDAILHIIRRNKPVDLTIKIGRRPMPSRRASRNDEE